jgi:hypothetical protein
MRLVSVRRSTRPTKKLMATFDDGRVVHFGAAGYGDYIVWHRRSPATARAKKAAYLARHGATERWSDPATPATLSRYILWGRPTLGASIRAYKRAFKV